MSESFEKTPPQDPDKDKIRKENESVKNEIDEMERIHYATKILEADFDYRNEVSNLKQERDESKKILDYTNSYIRDNYQKVKGGAMSLGDFTDFIEKKENGFDTWTEYIINLWINKFKNKINLEKPVNNFLNFVEKKYQEAEYLLNPIPPKK